MQFTKVVLAVAILFVFLSLSAFALTNLEYKEGFALSTMVERSEIIVRGRVTDITGVWRDNMIVRATSDITITVDEFIKGSANSGENAVKFMVEGGTATDKTGEEHTMDMSGVPVFKMGEEILLFLFKGKENSFHSNYPHGQLYPYRAIYGSSRIIDDTVLMMYLLSATDDSDMKIVKFPIDLAINICKTTIIDKNAAVRFEEDIKAEMRGQTDEILITLPDILINRLKTESKQIIDNAEREN